MMTVNEDTYQALSEAYQRLVQESTALVKGAELERDGKALVSLAALNRLSRELQGVPQPSPAWMSAS
jgi:hypothetical protein